MNGRLHENILPSRDTSADESNTPRIGDESYCIIAITEFLMVKLSSWVYMM